jgi:hypothetical protein
VVTFVVTLARHPQTQPLRRAGVCSTLDIHEPVLFCTGWQKLDCFDSQIMEGIFQKSRANKEAQRNER